MFPQKLLAAALSPAILLSVSRALACGGPCTDGDIWDAVWVGDELNVVTNFGLLRSTEGGGFHLECEELWGGLLSAARFSQHTQWASTSVGAFQREDGLCNWASATEGASNEWFLDYALVGGEADAGSIETVVALVVDRETQQAKVERSAVGSPFTTVGTFSSTSGLRRLVAGGTPARVYATGYTYGPRIFHVASAPLSTTEEFTTQLLDREGEYGELRPLAVDPSDSNRLWLREGIASQEPDAIGVYAWGTEALTERFVLHGEEKVAGLSFFDGDVYLAGRGETSSTVYRGDPQTLSFEPIAEVPGRLTCLHVRDGEWLACNSDFTRESPWLVASSEDEGTTFEPLLQVSDLGVIASSCPQCSETTAWLFGVFGYGSGPLGDGGSLDRGLDLDSGAEADGGKVSPASGAPKSSCSCDIPGSRGKSWAVAGFLLAWAASWLRRQSGAGGRQRLCGL